MPQPQADPNLTPAEHPLADYQKDDFGEPHTTPPEPDDDPTGPDDFNPPTAGGSASEDH